jgi:hypothetical protein
MQQDSDSVPFLSKTMKINQRHSLVSYSDCIAHCRKERLEQSRKKNSPEKKTTSDELDGYQTVVTSASANAHRAKARP